MGNFLIVLGQLASFAIELLEVVIILQVVLSWLGVRLPLNQITRLFYALTEAVFRPIRAHIPSVIAGFDFSPLVALGLLFLIDRWLVGSLIRFGYQLSG